MKRAYIIARKKIISFRTKELLDDIGLFALNGYLNGNPRIIDDAIDFQELEQSLINEFEAIHPDYKNSRYQLVIDEDTE